MTIASRSAQPPNLYPDYKSTVLRAPIQPPIPIAATATEASGPSDWDQLMGGSLADLTCQHRSAPLGQRIIVFGRLLDEEARPVRNSMVEIWQANAAGRYIHSHDDWDAPLDPNFTGAGRAITDAQGRYRFTTIRPGAYPWRNHHNAWRPAHIHFSLYGPSFASRLVTQMYFPDDPLIELDPIATSVPEAYRRLLVSSLDMAVTEPAFALAYHFDIVLGGAAATPMGDGHG